MDIFIKRYLLWLVPIVAVSYFSAHFLNAMLSYKEDYSYNAAIAIIGFVVYSLVYWFIIFMNCDSPHN